MSYRSLLDGGMTGQLTHPNAPMGGRGTAVWTDKNGTTHIAVGSTVHPGIRLLWTECGKHDIPANKAWFTRPEDKVDCVECVAALQERLKK